MDKLKELSGTASFSNYFLYASSLGASSSINQSVLYPIQCHIAKQPLLTTAFESLFVVAIL